MWSVQLFVHKYGTRILYVTNVIIIIMHGCLQDFLPEEGFKPKYLISKIFLLPVDNHPTEEAKLAAVLLNFNVMQRTAI